MEFRIAGNKIEFDGGVAVDQNGVSLNDAASTYSDFRTVDLSSFAGKTIQNVYLVQESDSPAGNYNLYYQSVVLITANGTIKPIYDGQASISFTYNAAGETGVSAVVEHPNVMGHYGRAQCHGRMLAIGRDADNSSLQLAPRRTLDE